MQCQNKITIAHYNNGKSQIIGSSGIVSKSPSINGYYTDEVCNGKIEIGIWVEGDVQVYEPSIRVEWHCSSCGVIIRDNPDLPDENNLQEWINNKLV